ncbi:hypothetical protein K437DRAFT_265833 [Tilletiaria anomala UBC 951]|uniref:Uncharacterized protein n=1 Tax=Tilletiaria anomala (strain ATCC 24038 / CBS 436.72 / UBC 951) TaxID=1037660 RepID=A0A066WS19_TILAU|nr:uncharacterized protein K437DRAFT_265833 [Tilletiaria anomala UBC 951]KDN53475.1 hypothetical protein K437DRAFT_265833 [Tilletiaria anomala UBC 951]
MLSSIAPPGTLQGRTQDPANLRLQSQPSKKYVLLFALSKELPRNFLSEAVSLLRGSSGTEEEKLITTRLGLLSSSVPASLIPPSAMNPNAPPLAPQSTIFSAALSLLPASHVIPFRSMIQGKQPAQVGRWPESKESWKDSRGKQKLEALNATFNGVAAVSLRPSSSGQMRASPGNATSDATGWRQLWGRENITGELPASLETLRHNFAGAPNLLSTILFSNTAPQGLLEGLDLHFPRASCAGVVAPATPFETGRAQTLFFKDAEAGVDEVSADGAVGIALVAGGGIEAGGASLKVETKFEGLTEFGPRRAITGARGNIISTLEGGNATQQFLRDIQQASKNQQLATKEGATMALAREGIEGAELALKTGMSRDEARDISKGMKKEDEFYLGVFECKEGGLPILLARILSGSPSRGSLSLDTDVELESAFGSMPTRENAKRYVQFYQADPSTTRVQFPSALDIPGLNPSDWASPRFLFLTPSLNTLESGGPSGLGQQEGQAPGQATKRKTQVLALPNMFVAASERGWISRSRSLARGCEGIETSDTALQQQQQQAHVTNVPGSSVMLSLVVQES